ncbi:hypothetical protein [Catelliglobosispora koreensis]|uniref:hypothetical protein n=1 Tax=Catelliglobosispora koreensis TaxID=129052 RepID=UPI0003672C2C|nr:hypothetical protein [Catelliglobosispora koreensis]
MKKKLSLTLTAMLVGVGAAVAVTTPAYAECGPAIIDIYDLNWSKYAVVHNSC